MREIAVICFWTAAVLLAYTYLGYPLLLSVKGLFIPRIVPKEDFRPSVSVLIAAYNEEKHIAERIRNLLGVDYPRDKLEILVGSDCSNDQTVARAREVVAASVRVFDYRERKGKLGVMNFLAREARGEVFILTDANNAFAKETVRELVAPLHDKRVGIVAGQKCIIDTKKTGTGERKYRRVEAALLRLESEAGSCVSVDGSIYAVRGSLYPYPTPPVLVMDDLIITLSIMQRGFRCVFQPNAKAFEDSSVDFQSEFRRKARIIAGSLNVFRLMPRMVIPFKSKVAFELISHKLLRYAGGPLLALLLAANLLLIDTTVYRVILLPHIAFYCAGLVGLVLAELGIRLRVFYYPFYFLFMNYATFYAFSFLLKQGKKPAWERIGR